MVTAVVAKAPRKNVVPGRSSVISPGSAAGKRKGKAGNGGNPLKLWPVPKGQKGLQSFLGSSDGDSSSSAKEGTSSSELVGDLEEEEESAEASTREGSSTEEDNVPITSCSKNFLEDITQLNSDSEED